MKNNLFSFLGNHILSDSDLIHFHNDLLHDQDFSTPSSKHSLIVSKYINLKSLLKI